MSLTREEVDRFLSKYKRKAERTLSILGRHKDFMDAKDTELGREFLSDLIMDHERLLESICEFTATEEDKAEFKVVQRLIRKYSEKIAAYYEATKEIKNLEEIKENER